jgi:hypothetical protein
MTADPWPDLPADRMAVATLVAQGTLWVASDGGRAAAGYRGDTGDCATRAVAIAAGLDYRDVYDRINTLAKRERTGTRKRTRSNARLGVHRVTMHWLIVDQLGGTWTPTMTIGSGCTTHLLAAELPAEGRHVLSLSRHYAAWVDGVLYDTHDCSRYGTRCVYGYWTLPEEISTEL